MYVVAERIVTPGSANQVAGTPGSNPRDMAALVSRFRFTDACSHIYRWHREHLHLRKHTDVHTIPRECWAGIAYGGPAIYRRLVCAEIHHMEY